MHKPSVRTDDDLTDGDADVGHTPHGRSDGSWSFK